MVQVGGENAEDFELEPTAAVDDGDQAEREDHTGGDGIDGVLADGDGGEGQKKREAGDDLRVVTQGVDDHHHGDGEEQYKIYPLGIDDAGVWHEIHRVGGEEGERPAAADERAGKDAVAFFFLEPNAGGENDQADQIAKADFFGIGERGKLDGQEERDADYQNGDADFVEPVSAETALEFSTDFTRGSRCRRAGKL